LYQVKIIVDGKGLPKVIFWQPFSFDIRTIEPKHDKRRQANQ
jgi:hypothetical protein